MVNRNQDGPFAGLACGLQALQLRSQEIQLIIYQREVPALRGNDAPARVHHIAVKANDGYVRSVEREVNPGLSHATPNAGRRIWRGIRGGSTEIREEPRQGRNLRRAGGLAEHHAVVIARYRKNGTIIFTVRFVKLVVIILA